MRRWWSPAVLILVAHAALFSYFVWYGYFQYVQPKYDLPPWEARWVGHPSADLKQAYFRKQIHIVTKPANAWLLVMAPDSFTLFVNGKRISSPRFDSAYAQGLFDITPNLVAGTNVIAIVNNVTTYRRQPRIAVQGQYADWNGRTFEIKTDGTWRTTARSETIIPPPGLPPTPWSSLKFDDGRWPYVVEGPVPTETLRTVQNFSASVITQPIPAQWIWVADPNAPEAYFRLTLDLPHRPKDAWVRLAARRYSRVLVNGYAVATSEQTIGTAAPSPTAFNVYNITPFLHGGRNVVGVQASSDRSDRGLIIDGYVEHRAGKVTWFSSTDIKASAQPAPRWEASAFDDSHWTRPVVAKTLTPDDMASLPKEPGIVQRPFFFQLRIFGILGLIFVVTLSGIVALWVLSARTLAGLTGDPPEVVSRWLPLTSLPPLLFMGIVYVLGYDPRFSAAFPFEPIFIWSSVAFLFLLHLILIGAVALARAERGNAPVPGRRSEGWVWPGRLRPVTPERLAVAVLTIVGFLWRLKDAGYESLRGDEATYALATLGVLERGYPSALVDGQPRQALTSELVAYLKAPLIALFGFSAFSLRLTDVIFGLATIPLIYWAGRIAHGKRTGLIAAAAFAIIPSAIGMTHYSRYPSILLFFALLNLVFFLRAFGGSEFQARPWYLGVLAFIMTYLSWEGSAFYGPSLAAGVLVLTRPRFGWVKNRHVWFGVAIILVALYFHLGHRTLVKMESQIYGVGAGDVQPALVFLYPFYLPKYYINYFFLLENHFLITLVFLLGAPLWFRRSREGRVLGYMATTLIVDLVLMTNFLELQAWRYVYSSFPLLILSASMTLVIFFDYLRAVCRPVRVARRLVAALRLSTATAIVLGILFFSTDAVAKLYTNPWAYPSQYTRLGLWNSPDTAGAAEFIREHFQPGDIMLTVIPHVYGFNLKNVDYYFLQTILRLSLVLGTESASPLHRITGDPAIVSPDELKELMGQSRRIWLTLYDLGGADQGIDAAVSTIITDNMPVLYEDIHAVVYLFGVPR